MIDANALAATPPEFLVRPAYDPHLQAIAERRSDVLGEIAEVFEAVAVDPRGEG